MRTGRVMGLWGKGNTTYLRKRKTTKKKNAYRASLVSFRYIFCVSLVACFSCRLLHHLGVRLRYFHTITTLIDTLYFHRQQHLATILSLLDLVCVSFSSSSPSFRGFHMTKRRSRQNCVRRFGAGRRTDNFDPEFRHIYTHT